MISKRNARQRAGAPRAVLSPKEILEGTPPQNLDAERAVLGSILRVDTCLNDVARIVTVDSFYSDRHQKIFQAILGMLDAGKSIDVTTLGEELARRGELLEIGGAPTLLELFQETLTAANATYYAQIVRDKAVLRNLIQVSTDILRDAYAAVGDPDDLLQETEKRIFSILENRLGQGAASMEEVLTRAFDRISHRQKRDGTGVGGIPSRFHLLDEMTDGWQNSELIILAARPGMGKTSMALNFIEDAILGINAPSLFVSLEMSELELAERLLCSHARVNGHMLRKNRLDSDQMQKLIASGNDLSQAPLFIDDTPGQNMLRICATARRLKLRNDLRFIVVDYLQLIEPDDKTVSRAEQIGTISRRLKNLARELKVPVIALSQLNRGVENREGHRPRMSDLRESGSIEQDADVVLLLHREDAYGDKEKENQAELIVAKNRNGPIGNVPLTFLKELTRFENFAPEIPAFGEI